VFFSLEGANLERANVRNSNFRETNLLNAHVSDKQLMALSYLQGAMMPNGVIYDGRFNLRGDIMIATKFGNARPEDSEAMAHWYGISLVEYIAGQEWARKNLLRLRREAGLDPATGESLSPPNGIEQQPADIPPAPPAPRPNGHKASMVSHRVRR
jgi:hypothetical protein